MIKHLIFIAFFSGLGIFGGCAAWDKIRPATTQAIGDVNKTSSVIADATQGTPIHDIALLVTAVSGGILALDRAWQATKTATTPTKV